MKKPSLIDKAFLLKKTPLFLTLDLDLLLTIADKLGVIELEANDQIFTDEDQAHRMFFVAKGGVELLDPQNNPIAKLEAGDFFGDEALFSEKPRTYQAKSLQESILLSLSRTNLLSIISECPQVAVGLLQVYATQFPCRIKGETA